MPKVSNTEMSLKYDQSLRNFFLIIELVKDLLGGGVGFKKTLNLIKL